MTNIVPFNKKEDSPIDNLIKEGLKDGSVTKMEIPEPPEDAPFKTYYVICQIPARTEWEALLAVGPNLPLGREFTAISADDFWNKVQLKEKQDD